jgi:hypothetical protein
MGTTLSVAPALPEITTANALPGASLVDTHDKGVNETYIGVIETASEQRRAYLKILDAKQLANELICSTLGRAVGLPIPEGYVVRANPADFPDSKVLAGHTGDALIFGCAELAHPSLKRRLTRDGDAYILQLFASWSEWDTAAIFDEWIANWDRNSGNFLIETENRVWLIDHSHSLTGPAWTSADLVPEIMVKNQIADNRIPSLSLPDRVKMKTKTAQTAAIFSMVPIDAVVQAAKVDGFLGATELPAVVQFIQQRTGKIVELMSSRLGLPSLPL